MKLHSKINTDSGNPAGGAVFGGWRRCSSVGERYGYPPSSRLASHQNRLPQHHSDFENTP
jgi:hypothetical protein